MSHYQNRLGVNLRDARRRAGFSLMGLEEATKGEFKSSAVGAYERGERAISVTKLADLCRVYQVRPAMVIPYD